MRDNKYKRIFFLLSFCVLAILLLQGFWISNFYQQVKSRFEGNVYAGLENIVARLQERAQIKVLMERNGAFSPERVHVLARQARSSAATDISDPASVAVARAAASEPIKKKIRKKSVSQETFVYSSGNHKVTQTVKINHSFGEAGTLNARYAWQSDEEGGDENVSEKELDELMTKMLFEIPAMAADDRNPDTVRAVIRRELANKGIFEPFEFVIRRPAGKKEKVIVQSAGFDTAAHSYTANLSANQVFTSGKYMLLQFPNQERILLSSMKGSLMLSLLFLGVLLSVFYYTVRLILKQKKINDIRNDFVNNITHELKTPIATISLAADAMNNPQVRQNDGRYQDYTRILKEETGKLNTHVERVLQLALIERGELPLVRSKQDLGALTRKVMGNFELQSASKNISLVQHIADEPLFVYGDPEHLRSAIANLVDNAIKYSPSFSEITVSLEKNQHSAVLKVKDRGKGISAEEQTRIFEKFYRVPQAALHDVKGFGLGLNYVKSIVEAHGGNVTLVSEPGKGSVFSIQLPVI